MADAGGTNSSKKRKNVNSNSPANETVKTAAHPFDPYQGSLSDVVVRSSDGVDFFTHKLVLSLSSPVLEGIFRMPTPASTSFDRDDIRDGLPIVQFSETSRTLDSVLRFIYPIPPPDDLTLQEISDVLVAVDKYCLTGVPHRVQPLLTALLDDDPVGVYAVCAANRLNDLAGEAAVRTVKMPLQKLESRNIGYIPAKVYSRLMKFHFDADKIIHDFVFETQWFQNLRGLHKKSVIGLCSSCYDFETYSSDKWIIHRSFRLVIRHCESTRFFYHDLDYLHEFYENLSEFGACKTCERDFSKLESRKFIDLFISAVNNELKQVWIFATGSDMI
jgi:hypothetical protein